MKFTSCPMKKEVKIWRKEGPIESISDTVTHPHPACMTPVSGIMRIRRIPVCMREWCGIHGILRGRGVKLNSNAWRTSICEWCQRNRNAHILLVLLLRDSNRDSVLTLTAVVRRSRRSIIDRAVRVMRRSVVHLLVCLLRCIQPRIRLLLLLFRRIPIPVTVPCINWTVTITARLLLFLILRLGAHWVRNTSNRRSWWSRPDIVMEMWQMTTFNINGHGGTCRSALNNGWHHYHLWVLEEPGRRAAVRTLRNGDVRTSVFTIV